MNNQLSQNYFNVLTVFHLKKENKFFIQKSDLKSYFIFVL